MKKLLYTLLSITIISSSCDDDPVPPSVQTNPTTIPTGNYIVEDCTKWSVDITFSGTNFYSEETGNFFNIDSLHHYCDTYEDTVLMAANGVTWLDLLEEGYLDYNNPPSMRAEMNYPFGEPAELILKFPGSTGVSGTGIDPFQLRMTIEDIASYGTGDTHIDSSCMSANHWVWGNYDAVYTLTFNVVDVTNEQFGGNINIDFSPAGSLCLDPNSVPGWITYDPGVSEYFTATIDFWFDNN
tara:strand:- start:315 stop:1034 length:720 start_codon:yes stop_codon:yes gene_type:complete